MMSRFDDPHRGMRDLELPGLGDPSEDAMLATLRDIPAQIPTWPMASEGEHSVA